MCRTANEESVIEGGNGGMVFKMHRPQNELYTNLKTGRSANSQEFMGKKFLIKADVTQLPWKITGEMDQILGYNCLKATMTDTAPEGEEREIVAWFTNDIPVAAGPSKYGTLPGMILKMDINDGNITFTATEIEVRLLEKGEIKEPKRGKEVTREEYDAIVKAQIEKMKSGNGGTIMIRGN
jgi:GLPGLI family protein